MTTKITGYRELTEQDIETINKIKSMAQVIGDVINTMQKVEEIDQRWLAIAKTDLQTGFMALIRSIAQPTTF